MTKKFAKKTVTSDNEEILKVADLLKETMLMNRVEPGVCIAAMELFICKLCFLSDIPYEIFCSNKDNTKKAYKMMWEGKDHV